MEKINVTLNFNWEFRNDFDKLLDDGDYTIEINLEVEETTFEKIKEKIEEYIYSSKFLEEISYIKDDFDLKFYIRLYLDTISFNNKSYNFSEIIDEEYFILYFDVDYDESDYFRVDIVS